MNFNIQQYRNIPLTLINRSYAGYKAKRYVINSTNQNVWIPNAYLLPDGTIKPGTNLDFIFNTVQGQRKLELARVIRRSD